MFDRIRKRFKNQRSVPIHISPALESLEPRLLLSGTTFIVNTLTDLSDPNDNLLTLREAIEAANTNLSNGNIPAGSATEVDNIAFNQSALELEANGVPLTITLNGTQLTITDSLNIQGLGANLLTIDANQLSRVLSITGFDTQTQIAALTLTGGLFDAEGEDEVDGGAGVYIFNSTVNFTNTIISNNINTHSFDDGGGIYSNAGNLTLTNSIVTGNHATGSSSYGGGQSTT